MKLEEARRRLPIVDQLPAARGRFYPAKEARRDLVPRLVVWELTLACDQKCIHCGPRAGPKRRDELTTEECLQLIREMADMGVGEVVLIGGEAYLRNDFILIIRAIREAGMHCTMTTGGYNLNPRRVAAMVEAGISSVTLSIDGLAETHDYLRGMPGSWQRAIDALHNFKAAGAGIACNTQINARTRHELLPLLEHLAKAGIHSWQLQITVAHGNAADHHDIVLQPYMMVDVFETMEKVLDRCDQLGVRFWPGNSLGYFGPLEARMRKHQGRFWRGCTAGISSMGIESDGGLKNCPSLGGPNNIGGSWREHGLRKVWEESYQLNYIRQRTVDDLWGYCRECYYASTCMAGCTAASEALLGRPGNNPFCHHRALEMDKNGLRERVEMVSAPPGGGFDNGLFRIICEYKDPEQRAAKGPVSVTEPRVSRAVEPSGPGSSVPGLPSIE